MIPIIITAFVCVPAGFLIAGAFLVPNYRAAIEALENAETSVSYWYGEYKAAVKNSHPRDPLSGRLVKRG